MCLYSICTSINLQCSSPTLSPPSPALPFCSLLLLFFSTLSSDYLSVFIPLLLLSLLPPPLSSIHPHLYPFIYPSCCISPTLFVSFSPTFSLQCIRHITTQLLQNQPSLQQPALKLMAESGDEQLLQLTLDQINSISAVSVFNSKSGPNSKQTKWSLLHESHQTTWRC